MQIRSLPRLAAALGFASLLIATGAGAQSVAIQATAEGTVGGVTTRDIQGPATSGELLAAVEFPSGTGIDLTGAARAQAAQNAAGISAVLVDGAYTVKSPNHLRGQTRWAATVTNNSGGVLQYNYRFFVVPPALTILDLVPFIDAATSASWHIRVTLNGQTLFESGATMTGGNQSHALDLVGTPFGQQFVVDPVAHTFGYVFGGFNGVLPLGSLGPGQSLTVETVLTATADVLDAGRGARAAIGDPLKLGSDPGMNGVIEIDETVAAAPATWSAVKAIYGH
jgi:hypothetical protein